MIAFISLSHFSIPRLVFLFPNKLFALMPWLRICMWETQTQTVILKLLFPLLISNTVLILQDISQPQFLAEKKMEITMLAPLS